jgi:hypothetical protein
MTIANNHPLSRIPLVKALPYLSVCRCCMRKQKKDFRYALMRSLLKKMQIKMPKTDVKLEEDPYLRLGFGMNAYFDTLKFMMILMFCLFVFSLPAMHIYSSYNSLMHENMYLFTRFSLGNLGGASPVCSSAPIDSEYLPMHCKTGMLRADQARFGIIPESSPKQNQCLNDEFTSKCMPLMNEAAVLAYIVENCADREKCQISVRHIKEQYTRT